MTGVTGAGIGYRRHVLALLSPAKTLDLETRPATRKRSEPRLLDEAEALVSVMRSRSPEEVAELMDLSEDLARLNVQRYAEFSVPHTWRNARPAVLAFAGDVYQGLAAPTRFDERDFTEAQKTVRILSGLYGVLRPLDLVQPYRLEMGVRLRTERGSSLYDWWGDRVTRLLAEDLQASPGAPVVVDLASQEYARVLRPDVLGARLVTPRFEDADASGRHRVVSFFAKRARGMMAGWMVQHRVHTPSALRQFDEGGYRWSRDRSTPDEPVFLRDHHG